MFNNLAAYLLGTTTNHQQPSRASSSTDDESTSTIYGTHHHQQHHQQQLNSIRLTSSSTLPAVLPVDVSDDEEDDWVLVDRETALQNDNRDSEGNSTLDSSSSEEEDSDNEQSPAKISNTSSSPPDFDITHLLLPSTANTSPMHSTSYQSHLLATPTSYTRNQLSSLSASPQLHQRTPLPITAVSNTMEESWFLTPPPCFTSTGPVHMETSPLENLLIEHPSMSVYQNVTVGGMLLNARGILEAATQQQGGNSSSSTKPSPITDKSSTSSTTVVLLEEVSSDLEDEAAEALLFEVDEEVERGYLRAAQQQQRRRRGNGQRGYNRVAAGEVMRYQQQQRQERHLSERQQQGVRNKQAQKVQIHRACQSLKRSYLERNNKAREVNFRNQRLRRGERSQGSTRSNANNNRKCC